METLAKRIAASIGKSLEKTDEEIAVIAYGLIGILQFLAILIISLTIGIIFGMWAEVLVIFFSVGFLRRLTGGAHSRGIYNCLVYSVCFVCGFSAISVYALPSLPIYYVILPVCCAIYLFGYITIALKAPVTPPNKPCRTEAKRRRLRRGAFIVLTAFLAIDTALILLGTSHERLLRIGLALALSVLWQIFMMTRPGHLFISVIDGAFLHKESKA